MESLIQDTRYALRALLRTPAFTIVAVVTLALGIGANTAIFSVVKAVLITPLAYSEPDRLMQIWEHNIPRSRETNVVNPGNFQDWKSRTTSFQDMAFYTWSSVVLTGDDAAERVQGRRVTHNTFDVLGVRPLLGRTFQPSDADSGATRTIVLGHALWARRFGADPDVVGTSVPVAGGTALVIGVMPPAFRPLDGELYWDVLPATPSLWTRRGRFGFVIGRLRQGVEPAAAAAELRAVGAALEQEYPDFNTGWSVNALPLAEQVTGSARGTLLVLLGAVGFVLLIACANVGNLLLSRAAARQRELAVRTALGASGTRLVRLWLTETMMLTLAGATLGLLLAVWGLDLLRSLAPADLPRLEEIRLDGVVLAVSGGVAVLVAVVLGAISTLGAAWRSPLDAIRGGDLRTTAGVAAGRFRGGLVVSQVALALVLMVGAGLLIRSLSQLRAVDPGFDSANLVTASVSLPGTLYPDNDRRLAFFDDLTARVRAIPGVANAGLVSTLPLGGLGGATSFRALDQAEPPAGQWPVADIRSVDDEYLATMRIGLQRGRGVGRADLAGSPPSIVVSEVLARETWPGEDPLGKQLLVNWNSEEPATVVGVVDDVRHAGLDASPRGMIYYSQPQSPSGSMTLVVRSALPAAAVTAALRSVLQQLDRNVPLTEVATMTEVMDRSVGGRTYPMVLLALFAAVALALSAIGLYGVLAYAIGLRTREIGVRIALGAQPMSVVRMVVGGGLALAGIGVLCGAVGALAASRLLASLLFEVKPADPATFAGVALVLMGAALLASWIPARRAARVDPMEALRSE